MCDPDRAAPFRHPLAVVRQELGRLSYAQLAKAVAAEAERLFGVRMAANAQKAYRWEHGVEPEYVAQLALASLAGVPHDRVKELPWPRWLPTGDEIDVEAPWTPQAALALVDEAVGRAMHDRRGFLVVAGGALVTMASGWPEPEWKHVAHALGGGQVDDGVVRAIESRLPGLRHCDATLGGEHVREAARADLQLVARLLTSRSHRAGIERRLYAVATELASLAGWASFDAGLHAAAQRYWLAAVRCAHQSGDRVAAAHVLAHMSLQCLDVDACRDAVALAEAAQDLAGQGIPHRMTAILVAQRARAYARLGDRRQCREAVAVATTAMGRSREGDLPEWAAFYDEAEFAAQVGSCYLDLGDLDEADRWIAHALSGEWGERRRDHATYLLRRATARASSDPGLALELTRQAIPLLQETDSTRNKRRVSVLRAELRPLAAGPRASTEAAELYQQLAPYAA